MDDIIAITLMLFLATISISCVIISKLCLCCGICFSKNSSGHPKRICMEQIPSENPRTHTSRSKSLVDERSRILRDQESRSRSLTAWDETSLEKFKNLIGSTKNGPDSHLNSVEIFA